MAESVVLGDGASDSAGIYCCGCCRSIVAKLSKRPNREKVPKLLCNRDTLQNAIESKS